MQDEQERFSHLVSRIYDAALAPALWRDTLADVAEFVGGRVARLIWHDLADQSAGLYFTSTDNEHFTRTYIEQYVHLNPLLPAAAFAEVGEILSTVDVLPAEQFVETRFYKEWLKPQGIVDGLFVNLERGALSCSSLAVERGEEHGPADPEARRRMSLIVPHMRRAISIGHIIAHLTSRDAVLTETLDRVASAVYLLDAGRNIVFANDRGRELVRDGGLLRDRQGTLRAADPNADEGLAEAVAAASNGDEALGQRAIAIPLCNALDTGWVAHLLPLTSGVRSRTVAAQKAVAALFVRKMGFHVPSALEILGKMFKLTGMELRVLGAIVEQGGVPEVAGALGCSESTVRTHLKSLFSKTGTHRQADLVKLVAGVVPPHLD